MGTVRTFKLSSATHLLFIFSLFISHGAVPEAADEMMKLELIHRHSPRLITSNKTQFQRIKELVEIDVIRHRMISHKRRMAWEFRRPSAELPIHSGRDYQTGQYFVEMKLGRPSQRFLLIADTGSDLTWVKCREDRDDVVRSRRRGRVFKPECSSSFKTVPCSSEMCKVELSNMFSLTRCPTPLAACAYDYRYADGSSALGSFANETITVNLTNGRKTRLHNMLIGCSEAFKGQSFQSADGVMGLGYSKHSLAAKASEKFGGKFSYCLVDHLSHKNVSNYLSFGRPKTNKLITKYRRSTELLLDGINPFYAIKILGISIGGSMLRIPSFVWDISASGGAIVDSGTSLTLLTQVAYEPIMSALVPSLRNFKRFDLKIDLLEYCFNSTGFVESLMPRLVFHFAGGARFMPPVKSYVIDAAEGVKCLGFASVGWPGVSVIGNIMQQNHLVEFDLVKKKLSFTPSSCTID